MSTSPTVYVLNGKYFTYDDNIPKYNNRTIIQQIDTFFKCKARNRDWNNL